MSVLRGQMTKRFPSRTLSSRPTACSHSTSCLSTSRAACQHCRAWSDIAIHTSGGIYIQDRTGTDTMHMCTSSRGVPDICSTFSVCGWQHHHTSLLPPPLLIFPLLFSPLDSPLLFFFLFSSFLRWLTPTFVLSLLLFSPSLISPLLSSRLLSYLLSSPLFSPLFSALQSGYLRFSPLLPLFRVGFYLSFVLFRLACEPFLSK